MLRNKTPLWRALLTAVLLITLGASAAAPVETSTGGNKPDTQMSAGTNDTPAAARTWAPSRKPGWISTYIILPPGYEFTEARLKMGDDAAWSSPDLDDSQWEEVSSTGVPTRAGIFWVRFGVRGPTEMPAAAYVKVSAAYDLFWDGRHVVRSGVPGNTRDEEKPGPLDANIGIPADWRGEGEHLVAFRLSTYRAGFKGDRTDLQFWLGTRDPVSEARRSAIPAALAEGAMLMIALVSLVMWALAARRATLLLFVGLCLCAALTQAITVQRFAYTYTYDWHYPARLAAAWASLAMSGCLIAFIGLHFTIPRWKWLVGFFLACAVTLLALPGEVAYMPLSEKTGYIARAGFIISLIATLRACQLRRTGARVAAFGITAGLVAASMIQGQFVEGAGFFPTFLPVMLGLAAAVALGVREERQKAHAAQLTAARLQVELLKKNLQPHFLLNTLTALTEVIEQNPTAAVRLIEDLAVEFRTLSRMAGEKQVCLEQELELCRVHLRVMSVRTGITWQLAAENIDPNAPVPPALFLTLVENGLLHQKPSSGVTTFRLVMDVIGDDVRYTFFSPGEVKPRVRTGGGTGLRYVKARLEESFPGTWGFSHGPVEHGWETTITVHGIRSMQPVLPSQPEACNT